MIFFAPFIFNLLFYILILIIYPFKFFLYLIKYVINYSGLSN